MGPPPMNQDTTYTKRVYQHSKHYVFQGMGRAMLQKEAS